MSLLRTALWDINEACNLNCTFCYHLAEGDPWSGVQVELADAEAVLNRLQAAGTNRVYLVGGEPFLHRDLKQIAEAALARGIAPTVTTNGTVHRRYRDHELVRLFEKIEVSIDSFDDSYLASIGRGSTANAVRDAVALLRDAAVPVEVITCVTKKNLHEVEAVGDFCVRSGVEAWKVQAVHMTNRHPRSDELRLEVAEMEALVATVRPYLEPSPTTRRYLEELESLAASSPKDARCNAPTSYVYIDVHGRFSRCPTIPATLAGDLFAREPLDCPSFSLDCISCFDLIQGASYRLERKVV